MIKTSSIELMKTLSRKELKEFYLFISSPFHNTNQSVIRLFDCLREYHPSFSSNELTKEKLYGQIYSAKPYNEQTMKSVLFNLAKLLEEYLTLFALSRYKAKKDFLLSDELMLREKLKASIKVADNSYETESKKGIDRETLYNLHNIDYLRWQAASFLYDSTSLIKNFSSKTGHFLLYVLAEFMYDINAIDTLEFNHRVSLKGLPVYTLLEKNDWESFISEAKRSGWKYAGLAEMYLSIINFFIQGYDYALYVKAKDIFRENLGMLQRSEIYGVSTILINMCRKFERTDEEKFTREKLDVYRLQLEQNAYHSYEGAPLNIDKFRNIVNAGLYLKELSWTENFIESYVERLPAETRAEAYALSHAYLFFEKGMFEKALESLAKLKIDYISYKADLRMLQLRCYYEMDFIEEAFSSADALRHYIKSDDVSASRKDILQRFVNYFTRLLKLKVSSDSGLAAKLNIEITNDHNLASRSWFLKKLYNIKNL